jgi:hypothetical protein
MMPELGLLFALGATTSTAAAFSDVFRGLLAARQIDDLGVELGSDLLQLGAAEEGALELEMLGLHGDDGKAWPPGTLANMATFSNKDLGHWTVPF